MPSSPSLTTISRENSAHLVDIYDAFRNRVDLFVFYSYRYYTAFHGLPAVAGRAVLVPTAEDDDAIRLPVFRELFRKEATQ